MLKKTEPIGHVKDIILDEASADHRILCVTPTISEIKTLDELIGCKVTHTPLMLNNACAVIAHGQGRPVRKAMAASTALELPMLYTDFGPLKTYNHKKHQALSMTFDHLGFVHGGDRETYLESLIKSELSEEQLNRSQALISQWKSVRASKFNHGLGPELPAERFVVVLAEPTPFGGDKKVSRATTAQLVAKATQAFPTHKVVVVPANEYAADALEKADAAFVHSSPVGFESLLWGTPTYAFGMPFYAGWGVTNDSLPSPERRMPLTHGIAQLAYAYLVRYSRYVNPYDSSRISTEQALNLLARTREAAVKEATAKREQKRKRPKWLQWL